MSSSRRNSRQAGHNVPAAFTYEEFQQQTKDAEANGNTQLARTLKELASSNPDPRRTTTHPQQVHGSAGIIALLQPTSITTSPPSNTASQPLSAASKGSEGKTQSKKECGRAQSEETKEATSSGMPENTPEDPENIKMLKRSIEAAVSEAAPANSIIPAPGTVGHAIAWSRATAARDASESAQENPTTTQAASKKSRKGKKGKQSKKVGARAQG